MKHNTIETMCCQTHLKFTLAGSEQVRQALSKAKRLTEVKGYDSVYISPDRSVEPERVHVIKKNKIVSSDKN